MPVSSLDIKRFSLSELSARFPDVFGNIECDADHMLILDPNLMYKPNQPNLATVDGGKHINLRL